MVRRCQLGIDLIHLARRVADLRVE
jgi:hypothetical protein